MQTFLIRFFSALVLLFIVSAFYLWLGNQGLLLIIISIILYGTKELTRMLWAPPLSRFFYWFGFAGIALHIYSSIFYPAAFLPVFAISVSLVSVFAICFPPGDHEALDLYLFKFLFLFFYLGVLPNFVIRTLLLPFGFSWFAFHMITVFSGDTCAYIVGKKFGKKLLLPQISPKKTWEGAVAGFFGSLMFGSLAAHALFVENHGSWMLLTAGLVSVFAQIGDLFESLLKRKASTKDSGRLIPGHGGVLDRVDGVLFSAPILYMLAIWIQNLSSLPAFD